DGGCAWRCCLARACHPFSLSLLGCCDRMTLTLRPTDEATRHFAGCSAIFEGYDTADDGGTVALGTLDHAASVCWQVEHHFRRKNAELVEVDDVDVGFHAGGDHTAIIEAVKTCCVMRLHTDDFFERKARAAFTVAHPMGEHIGREARITDHAAMGATVRKAQHRCRVVHHLFDVIEVEERVVEHWQIDIAAPVFFHEHVIDDFGG